VSEKPADAAAALARVTAPNPTRSTSAVPLQGPLATLDDAYRYAYAMAQSGLLPRALQNNAANTLIVILYGQYLGIPPVIATQVISVVNGRPQIEGKMLVAKVREAGHKYRIVEHTGQKCRVRITRGDEPDDPYEAEFTLDEAVTAGLCSVTAEGKARARSKQGDPLPWELYTKDMLQWRATSRCVNVACPEIKMGLAVEGEETTEISGESRIDKLAKVVAQRGDHPDDENVSKQASEQPPVDEATVAQQLAEMEATHIYTDAPATEDQPVAQPPLDDDEALWAEVVEAEQQQAAQEEGRAK
jgi:hypothetical protein